MRFVQPPFKLHERPEVNEGIFARLDDSMRAELARLAAERPTEENALLATFFQWALRELDADAYAEIQNKYIDRARGDHECRAQSKFLNFPYYVRHKMAQLHRLGLHRGPSKRIFDLGCGSGHVHILARHFGHEIFGLDIPLPADHLYNALCAFFGAPKMDYRIEAMQSLPRLSQRCDLVTAFLAAFNVGTNGLWGEEQWRFFVEDARANLLDRDGKLYVTLTSNGWSAGAWRYLASVAEWTHNDRVALISREH